MAQTNGPFRPPPAPDSVKTSCLFCRTPVICQPDSSLNPDSREGKRRNEIIKTLCFHAQLEVRKVPKECTYEAFPFCTPCEEQVVLIWESDNRIKEASAQISRSMATIERTLADAELLKPRMVGSHNVPDKKFEKLSSKILDEYKYKLTMKQHLREKLLLGTPTFPVSGVTGHDFPVQDENIRREFKALPKRRADERPQPPPEPVASTSGVAYGRSSLGSLLQTIGVPPVKQSARSSLTSVRQASQQYERNQQPPVVHPSPQSATLNKSVGAVKPSYNGTTISAPRPVTATSSARPGPSTSSTQPVGSLSSNVAFGIVPPVTIKREPGLPEQMAPIPRQPGKRKRRYFIQGIEILRLIDNTTRQPYLQCTVCRGTVSNKLKAGEATPHQKMLQHVAEKHLGKRRRAALSGGNRFVRNKQYSCKECNETFPHRAAFLEHEAGHAASQVKPRTPRVTQPQAAAASSPAPAPEATATPPPTVASATPKAKPKYYKANLSCDICGRPVKGTINNLYAHLYSHKNNEEREIALRNGEKGAVPRKLNTQTRTPTSQKKPRTPITQQKRRTASKYPGVKNVKMNRKRNRATRVTRKQSTTMATTTKKQEPAPVEDRKKEGDIQCDICFKRFSRMCNLTLHMQTHEKRNQTTSPALITQRTVSNSSKPGSMVVNTSDNENDKTDSERSSSTAPILEREGDVSTNQNDTDQADAVNDATSPEIATEAETQPAVDEEMPEL